MTALPAAIQVGPSLYTITDDEGELLRACRDEQTDLLGRTNHRELKIIIRPDLAPGQSRDTVVHEALHALFAQVALADEWGAEKEEAVVARTTPALLDLLRRNPELVAYLTEDE